MSPLLRLILGLTPRGFRERHGGEVARVHAERLRALGGAGALRRAGFRAREVLGLLGLVARLRAEGWRGRREGTTEGGSMLERIRQDLRHALRTLRRNPAYTAAVVGILAVGIGADTAIFSAANAFLFRPLPFADPDRLVVLYETNPEFGWTADDPTQAAPANVLDWRERVDAFQDVALWESFTDDVTWVRDGDPVLLREVGVSGNFFAVLGVVPALGRAFRWEETWEGRDRVAVLSHGAWIREFGGDPGVVGRTLDLEGASVASVVVVGVMPEGFGLPSRDVDLWLPLGWDPADRASVSFRRAHWVWPVARLGPGQTLESADAELQAVVRT
ncbi:MAG TPA: ABC transporter permease, partial [Longimicrobiales bacterium]|nr:ABC transporter permease [Longimicrobiales bacterium]